MPSAETTKVPASRLERLQTGANITRWFQAGGQTPDSHYRDYMRDDDGYSRFFAYMNLFVASMLILVLGNNLLLLYLGWEGVGLCSYLLIGFWYRDPANVRAANKAFIVTRIGDTAMAIGLFLLFTTLGTLDIQELMRRAAHDWPVHSAMMRTRLSLVLRISSAWISMSAA